MKLLLCSTAVVFSAIPFASAAVDFEKDVKPILEQNCVRCHNPKDGIEVDHRRGQRREEQTLHLDGAAR